VVVRLPALGDVHEEGGDGIAVPVKAVDVAHIGLDQLGDRLDVVEVQPDGAGTDREVEVVREIEPLPVGADPEAVVRVNAAPVRIAGRSQTAGQRQRRPPRYEPASTSWPSAPQPSRPAQWSSARSSYDSMDGTSRTPGGRRACSRRMHSASPPVPMPGA
jgi:hypothetical protein